MDQNYDTNLPRGRKHKLISRILGANLQAYNQFVLENQDEIYTFVYTLLQDEYRASLIVQRFFVKLYHQRHFGDKKTLRKRLFSLSIAAIRELSAREKRSFLKHQKPGDCSRLELSQDNITLLIISLPLEQSLVISLIDIIGLNYEEAAEILAQPIETITRNLACARYSLCTSYVVLK